MLSSSHAVSLASRVRWVLVLGLVALLGACSPSSSENSSPVEKGDAIPIGKSTFIFNEYPPLADTPLTVWTFRPPDIPVDELPIVFVMHGFGRDAKAYRDDWVRQAREHGFLVIVPTFSAADFPGGDGYNLGSIFTQEGDPVPEAKWAFSAIEPLFDHVTSITASKESGYHLYGHSAGSQFVHRFLLFKPENRARTIVAANAGWYTMPSFSTAFPYGLEGAPASEASLVKAFDQRLVVHLGSDDDDPSDSSLRTTPEAMAQGAHRLERGRTFFRAAQDAADSLGVPFHWTLRIVPDVGHDNERMAADAAAILFGSSQTE